MKCQIELCIEIITITWWTHVFIVGHTCVFWQKESAKLFNFDFGHLFINSSLNDRCIAKVSQQKEVLYKFFPCMIIDIGNVRFVSRSMCYNHVRCDGTNHVQKCAKLAPGFGARLWKHTDRSVWEQGRHQRQEGQGQVNRLPQEKESTGWWSFSCKNGHFGRFLCHWVLS